jgi:hypothetical protein
MYDAIQKALSADLRGVGRGVHSRRYLDDIFSYRTDFHLLMKRLCLAHAI